MIRPSAHPGQKYTSLGRKEEGDNRVKISNNNNPKGFLGSEIAE